MSKKRRFLSLHTYKKLRFLNFVLVAIILIAFVNATLSVKMLEEKKLFWGMDAGNFMLQFTFVVVSLILVATLVYVLHYGFGAVSRMERILDEIAGGNYSLRINLRKKDIMLPLAEKMNKVISLLEKKAKNQ
ncbi:MAG: hypothetical protein GF375_02930 [Candidatus Omnitrophica bacterium]|nr:hypothetical protein [Candidatus Omnitrophota bacterium]MBD3269052.1 hypothetical protein [Candidatus Omnitrophota bacterium]